MRLYPEISYGRRSENWRNVGDVTRKYLTFNIFDIEKIILKELFNQGLIPFDEKISFDNFDSNVEFLGLTNDYGGRDNVTVGSVSVSFMVLTSDLENIKE